MTKKNNNQILRRRHSVLAIKNIILAVVPGLVVAGVLLAANMYYDIDTGTIKMEDSFQNTGTTVNLSPSGAVNITAGAASTWKTTSGQLDIKTTGGTDKIVLTAAGDLQFIANSGAGTFDIDAATINLDTQTVDVTLKNAVDALNFDSSTLSINALNNRIGLGTSSPAAKLDIYGTDNKIRLSYNATDYADLSVDGSGNLTIDTQGGQVHINDDLYVSGDIFSTSTPAAVRKDGELILRDMVPIFGFDLPAQTASASYVAVSRTIENYPFPAVISDTTRVHKLIFRYSASTTDPITWRIYNVTDSTTTASSTLPATDSKDLAKGKAYITATTTIPTPPGGIAPGDADDWRVDVKTAAAGDASVVRIFQIFLAAYDRVQ